MIADNDDESYISLTDGLDSEDSDDDLIDENISSSENVDSSNSNKNINSFNENKSKIIDNLVKSKVIVKSEKKNEYRFNRPNQKICLTNVTDDINSLRCYIELLDTPRAKIKDINLLKIKNETKNTNNYLIPSGFQLMGSYPHHIKKIRLGKKFMIYDIYDINDIYIYN